MQEGYWLRLPGLLADKANYYIGQSQYIPVYETAANMVFINWQMTKKGCQARFKVPMEQGLILYQ
jgi:hypothetical protein